MKLDAPQIALLRVGETGERYVFGVPLIDAQSSVDWSGCDGAGHQIACLQRCERLRRHLVAGAAGPLAPRTARASGAALVIGGMIVLDGSINFLGQWLIENVPILSRIEDLTTSKQLQNDILKRSKTP